MIKTTLFFILFSGLISAQDQLKEQLLNYDFNRLKISISARSMIVDMVRSENFDSAWIVIGYCDSIHFPDSSWLSKRERFLIHFLEADTGYLLKKNIYTDVLGLQDTKPSYPSYSYNYINQQMYSQHYMLEKARFIQDNYPDVRFNLDVEDVGRILLLLSKEKRRNFINEFPSNADLWDFLELLFNFNALPRDSIPERANAFLKKHLKSRFRDLVAYNFSENYKRSPHGFSVIAKFRWDAYPEETNSWIDDHPTFSFEGGYIFHGISVSANFGLSVIDANSPLVNGTDTLPDTVHINPTRFQSLLGYTFFLPKNFIITPGLALDIFTPGPNGKKYEDFSIPSTIGGGVYLTLEKGIAWNPMYYAGRILNFRIGAVYNDLSRIRDDLGNWSLFIETGYGWKGFGRTRDYSY